MKEELAKEKGMKNATEEFIDGLYYHGMYFSEACWKDDPRVVKRNLKKLKSETAKYKALKEKVKGFGWEQCKHTWSKNGRKYTIDELADHLRRIIKEERGHEIPREPVINVPKRLNLPILGMQTDDVKTSDGQYVVDENKFKMNAQKPQHEKVLK